MRFFSNKELACPCCGEVDMDVEFMIKLNLLRNNYGKPMYLNSAYRCFVHNSSLGGRPAHLGRGVDVSVMGSDARELVGLAIPLGFTGIGIKQHGSGRFVHLDTVESGEFEDSPRPWIWTYK